MWEGLSAFEHAQCTLLARGLPLVKSSLPCSLSPLSLPWLLCSNFFFILFAVCRENPVCGSSFPMYSVLPLYVGLHVLCFIHSFECDICANPAVEDV